MEEGFVPLDDDGEELTEERITRILYELAARGEVEIVEVDGEDRFRWKG